MLSSSIILSFHYAFKLIFSRGKEVMINRFVNECEMYVLHCVFL